LLFQIVLAPTILDFTKSRMNGAKVAKSVRIHPSDRPIVFASSYSESAAVGPVQHEKACRAACRFSNLLSEGFQFLNF
jgi:hypothetical protein